MNDQPKSLPLRLDQVPGIGIRVSTPAARGWATVARNPHELHRAVVDAFREADVAGYASRRGSTYDLDEMTMVDQSDPLAARGRRLGRRTDTHNPMEWSRLSDGRWQSPGGRRYREECEIVQRVLAKRKDIALRKMDE